MSRGRWLYHDRDERGFDWGQKYDLDLGDGHYFQFTGWHGDKGKHGGIFIHQRASAPHGYCSGGITFDTPISRKHLQSEAAYMQRNYPETFKKGRYPRPTWQVESWDPLTISPSVRCLAPIFDSSGKKIGECGDHGFIKQGKWVRA